MKLNAAAEDANVELLCVKILDIFAEVPVQYCSDDSLEHGSTSN